MHDSASFSDKDWSVLLHWLTTRIGLDLSGLAAATKALLRGRGVRDAATLLRLALARGPGGMSYRQTVAWAHRAGIAHLSDAALCFRLHGACDFLAAIVSALLLASARASPLARPGRVLRIADSTVITRPGSHGTDWRVHGVYDLGAGGFSHLELTDGHGGEALDRGAAVAGEIRIADRGFSAAAAFRRFRQGAIEGGGDYVVRLRWSSLRLARPGGGSFDLIEHLLALPADRAFDDVAVAILDTGRKSAPGAPARIVVARKPEDAAVAERERLRKEASRRGKQLDPRSLIAAGFVVVATSLPAREWSAQDVLALYRLRWQIELAFKRLKSLLHIDRLPATTDKGARSWLLAHLILALATDAYSQEILESSP